MKEETVAFLKIAGMGTIFWILDICAAVSSAAFPVWWDDENNHLLSSFMLFVLEAGTKD